jgi:hypothetical protein
MGQGEGKNTGPAVSAPPRTVDVKLARLLLAAPLEALQAGGGLPSPIFPCFFHAPLLFPQCLTHFAIYVLRAVLLRRGGHPLVYGAV